MTSQKKIDYSYFQVINIFGSPNYLEKISLILSEKDLDKRMEFLTFFLEISSRTSSYLYTPVMRKLCSILLETIKLTMFEYISSKDMKGEKLHKISRNLRRITKRCLTFTQYKRFFISTYLVMIKLFFQNESRVNEVFF